MDNKPIIGLNDTEYKKIDEYVERLLNPLGIKNGFFEDSRVNNGTTSSGDSFIQNIKDLKKDDVRSYFFKNNEKLNNVMLSIKPEDRLYICKLMWDLINEDIKLNFDNFGIPATNTRLDRALGYGHENKKRKNSLDSMHLRTTVSLFLELPLVFNYEGLPSSIGKQENLNEYYLLQVPKIEVEELHIMTTQFIKKATELFKDNPRCKRSINACILRIDNDDMYLNFHTYRGFYEFRFSVLTSQIKFFLSDLMNKLTSLNPLFYYYAPSILSRGRTKICIVGSLKPTAAVKRFEEEIKKLTSVYYI
ncbi:MAG: hypothetical protein K6T94_00245 [Paenibacillus sp.]|nr:hypothetical protein [Paenibacillus sp.]